MYFFLDFVFGGNVNDGIQCVAQAKSAGDEVIFFINLNISVKIVGLEHVLCMGPWAWRFICI